MSKGFSVVVGTFLLAGRIMADPCTATLYEVGSSRKIPLYQWDRQEKAEGAATRVDVSFKDLQGSEVVREEALLESGKVRRYAIFHKQLNENGFAEVKGTKLHFSYTKEGKTKTSDEDLPENFVVTANLVDFVRAHWAELLKGDTIPIRFGVLDRAETVGFKLFKIEEKRAEGRDRIVIKMKPSSFIIAAIVDPILLTFDKEKRRLEEVLGRTLAKRKVGDRWKDLDSDTVYQFPDAHKKG